jgi:hypothetical protein
MNFSLNQENLFLPKIACEEFETLADIMHNDSFSESIVPLDDLHVSKESLISVAAWVEWHKRYDTNYPKLSEWKDRNSIERSHAQWLIRINIWFFSRPQHVVDFQNYWFKSCYEMSLCQKTPGLLGKVVCTGNYLNCEPFLKFISAFINEKLASQSCNPKGKTDLAMALFSAHQA